MYNQITAASDWARLFFAPYVFLFSIKFCSYNFVLNEIPNNSDIMHIENMVNKAPNSNEAMRVVNNMHLTTKGAQQFLMAAI